jgi:hypothetical protein
VHFANHAVASVAKRRERGPRFAAVVTLVTPAVTRVLALPNCPTPRPPAWLRSDVNHSDNEVTPFSQADLLRLSSKATLRGDKVVEPAVSYRYAAVEVVAHAMIRLYVTAYG